MVTVGTVTLLSPVAIVVVTVVPVASPSVGLTDEAVEDVIDVMLWSSSSASDTCVVVASLASGSIVVVVGMLELV